MNTDSKILWTRVDGAKSKREATLIGRPISRDWLTGSVSLARVRFVSEMKTAFGDLIDAAKASKINLPIVSLRTAMLCQLDNVITLDRHLGLRPDRTGTLPPAIELYAPLEYALPVVRETLSRVVKRWLIDDVETWAERHGLGHLAERLGESVLPGAFDLTPVQTTYINDNGQPNFALIAREIGERLVGETLFDGLGACELVASPDYTSNSVELMTKPKRGDGRYREDTYSMVARLTVTSVPYSGDIYLSVSAMKRVWAKKVPAVQFRSSSTVSAYVMAVGRPVSRVNVIKTQEGVGRSATNTRPCNGSPATICPKTLLMRSAGVCLMRTMAGGSGCQNCLPCSDLCLHALCSKATKCRCYKRSARCLNPSSAIGQSRSGR
jgi:hypothetical protein